MKKFIPLILIMPIMLSSCTKADTLVEKIVFGCDTMFNIKAYNKELKELNELEDTIIRYSKLFDGFTKYNNINNVYTINQTNEEVEISKELFDALKLADDYKNLTNGYFNPYLGELTYAYKEAFKNNTLPDENLINSALLHVTSFNLAFNEAKLTVKREGNALIDLGAFAKGYVIDKVKELAIKNEINHYFVTGGSSSSYFTSKPDGSSYNAGIRYIKKGYLSLKDTSLGISSIFEQEYIIDGVRYSHIINPFTGRPAMDYDFSVVIHENATLTDVFSTVLMCIDENTLNDFVKKFNFSYMIYKDSKPVFKSEDIELKTY